MQQVLPAQQEHDYLFVVSKSVHTTIQSLSDQTPLLVSKLQDTHGGSFGNDTNLARWSQLISATFE